MKIAIIAPSSLPVPAVKGGAVETLIDNFIYENERTLDNLEIYVFSNYERRAYLSSKNYKNTKFIWIKQKSITFRILNIILSGIRKLVYTNTPHFDMIIFWYFHKIYKFYKVIVEGNPVHHNEISRILGKNDVFYHVHSDIVNNPHFENIGNQRNSQIIAVSNYVRQRIIDNSKIPYENITVLMNGVRVNKNKNKLENIRFKFGLRKSDKVILFVGRIVQSKGIIHLLKALENISGEVDFRLLIVGSFGSNFGVGDEDQAQKAQVLSNIANLEDRVIFSGYVNQNEIYSYYMLSTIVVVPSICEDAGPLVPIEALHAGKPLIVTNSGGITEYVNSECAIIVEKENNNRLISDLSKTIIELLTNGNKRTIMEHKSLENSTNYNSRSYYNNFRKILLQT